MQYITPVLATVRAVCEAGGLVRTVRVEDAIGAHFVAGHTPLDGQAVADLLNAGVLVPDGARDLRLTGLPPFAAGDCDPHLAASGFYSASDFKWPNSLPAPLLHPV
jgi:hypothetical protein